MKNKFLQFIIVISIAASANCGCLANTESSAENSSEAPAPAISVPGSGGNQAPQVNQAIQESSKLSSAAKHVDVENRDGAVVLKGTVPTSGDKQRINSLAEQTGVQNVRNEIKVENSGTNKNKVIPKVRVITPKYGH